MSKFKPYKIVPDINNENMYSLKDWAKPPKEYYRGTIEECILHLKKHFKDKVIVQTQILQSKIINIKISDKIKRINIFENLIIMNFQQITSSKIYNEYVRDYLEGKEKHEVEISILIQILEAMNEENFANESFINELENICKQLKCNLIYPNLGDSYNAQIMSLDSTEESKKYQESSVIKVIKIGLKTEKEIIIKSEVVISR